VSSDRFFVLRHRNKKDPGISRKFFLYVFHAPWLENVPLSMKSGDFRETDYSLSIIEKADVVNWILRCNEIMNGRIKLYFDHRKRNERSYSRRSCARSRKIWFACFLESIPVLRTHVSSFTICPSLLLSVSQRCSSLSYHSSLSSALSFSKTKSTDRFYHRRLALILTSSPRFLLCLILR